jgi:hypothetical protein
MNEGPHCNLTVWKHFDSDWVKVTSRDGAYTTITYSEQDCGNFIEVDELREAVGKHCGDFWDNHI